MTAPVNVDISVEANTADTAIAFFNWTLSFYDKNPVITSVRAVLFCAAPLALVCLLFFWLIRKDSNRHVEEKMRIQIQNAQPDGIGK